MRMVFTESDQKRDFTLPAEMFIVGRQKQCGLSIRDLSISKEHCECQLAGSVLRIRDLGSRNGTWVNGERIGEQFVEVKATDDLIIGKVPVQLLGADQPAEMAPLAAPAEESEGTMFDPDFGSAVAWNQQQKPVAPAPVAASPAYSAPPAAARPAAAPAAAAPWAPPAAAPAPGGPGVSGQVSEPGLPPVSFAIGLGIHFIGTDPSSAIRLSASGVSGSHAKLEHAGGSWWIEDLGSKNGTYVNKQLITRSPLKPGDVVFIGPVKIDIAKPEVAAAVGGAAAPGAPAPARRSPMKLVAIIVVLAAVGLGVVAKMKQDGGGGGGGSGSAAGSGSDGGVNDQFNNALRLGVAEMRKGNYRDATAFLSTANQLKPHPNVVKLVELNSALSDRPTENIDKILEQSEALSKLTGDVWIKSGVVEVTRTAFEKWRRERDNAKFASIGDDKFDKSLWGEALEQYNKIQRDSEFYVARLNKVETAQTKIAEALREEAKALIKVGNCDEAIVKVKEALIIAPATMQTELINMQQVAQNNAKYAQMLRRGREEIANQNYDAAKQFLEQVPDTSIYFKDAAGELEKINYQVTKKEAQRLYQVGEGDKALALLKGATAEDLVALREKIESVVQVYTQAQELYRQEKYAQANELWETLKRMVGDPANQYYKWAEAGIKVDPTALSAQLAKDAQELYAAGKFLDAARMATRALKFNAKNVEALKLRKDFERTINLKFSIERQKWEASTDADKNAKFLKIAIDQYILMRAANPIFPLLGTIAEFIQKAGGEVPPPDSEDPEGNGSGS